MIHQYGFRNLFYVDETEKVKKVDQFIGFVSSHTTTNTVTCFNLHSFAVFHIREETAIVTCMLTARDHILLNMQDRVLQMMQLIQFHSSVKFSVEITNNFIGDDVQLDKLSMIGYKRMGFDTSKISQEDHGETKFSIWVEHPIPMVGGPADEFPANFSDFFEPT